MIFRFRKKDNSVLTIGITGIGQERYMPYHTRCKLKSGGSVFRKGKRREEAADTPRLSRQKAERTKTGNNYLSQIYEKDTRDILTDSDAVDLFNRVLLKKRAHNDQENS